MPTTERLVVPSITMPATLLTVGPVSIAHAETPVDDNEVQRPFTTILYRTPSWCGETPTTRPSSTPSSPVTETESPAFNVLAEETRSMDGPMTSRMLLSDTTAGRGRNTFPQFGKRIRARAPTLIANAT